MRGGGPLHNARDSHMGRRPHRYAPLYDHFVACAAPRGEARRIARSEGLRADTRPRLLKGVYEVNHLVHTYALSHTHVRSNATSRSITWPTWTYAKGPRPNIGPLFLLLFTAETSQFLNFQLWPRFKLFHFIPFHYSNKCGSLYFQTKKQELQLAQWRSEACAA